MAILAEGDVGLPVAEICRKHGISNALYYQWKSKYSGVTVNELKRMRELEAENSRLKKMYSELALENAAIKCSIPHQADIPKVLFSARCR